MIRVPTSPRLRRRLLRVGIGLVAACAVTAIVTFVPGHGSSGQATTTDEGPALVAPPARTYRITAADRRAIDATLDRFIPAAMERRSPETAWALAGPEIRSSSTLADWRTGDSPVPFYPARETSFHHWTTIDVEPSSVNFNLLLHPEASAKQLGTYVFAGQMVKRRGKWLVNHIYTIAIMNNTRTSREVGPADFAAPPGVSQPPASKPMLGRVGILPVLGILALVLLIPLGLGIVALVRARSWRRITRQGARNRPLPSFENYRPGASRPDEKTGSDS